MYVICLSQKVPKNQFFLSYKKSLNYNTKLHGNIKTPLKQHHQTKTSKLRALRAHVPYVVCTLLATVHHEPCALRVPVIHVLCALFTPVPRVTIIGNPHPLYRGS